MKLMNKIKNWFLKEELERIKELENENKKLISEIKEYQKEVKDNTKLVQSVINVGVDVSFYEESWAVICIKGHPEYVQFRSLGRDDTRRVIKFLNQFKYSNCIIDAPRMFFKF